MHTRSGNETTIINWEKVFPSILPRTSLFAASMKVKMTQRVETKQEEFLSKIYHFFYSLMFHPQSLRLPGIVLRRLKRISARFLYLHLVLCLLHRRMDEVKKGGCTGDLTLEIAFWQHLKQIYGIINSSLYENWWNCHDYWQDFYKVW